MCRISLMERGQGNFGSKLVGPAFPFEAHSKTPGPRGPVMVKCSILPKWAGVIPRPHQQVFIWPNFTSFPLKSLLQWFNVSGLGTTHLLPSLSLQEPPSLEDVIETLAWQPKPFNKCKATQSTGQMCEYIFFHVNNIIFVRKGAWTFFPMNRLIISCTWPRITLELFFLSFLLSKYFLILNHYKPHFMSWWICSKYFLSTSSDSTWKGPSAKIWLFFYIFF